MKSTAEHPVLSISQLNRQAKQLLEGEFPSVWVEGEISNFTRPASGHWYFSLKDDRAQVRCALFRNSNLRLKFTPEPGQQVLMRAKLSLYEPRGDYQLIGEYMEPAGIGALMRAFEELKARLQTEGLFDSVRKQPLPDTIQHIAVVTSPSGAAIHDILSVLARRFPAIAITIIPTAVQGKTAAGEIAAALDTANQLAQQLGFDAIIVGRGGGSLEDLWPFNEEVVARAIARSHLPVVSAVGHEVDITIADLVADVRAPTPSAAAELISPDAEELAATFAGYALTLAKLMQSLLARYQQQLRFSSARLRHPGSRIQQQQQRLDELDIRLQRSWRRRYQQQQQQLAHSHFRLQQLSPARTLTHRNQLVLELQRRLRKGIVNVLQQHRQRLMAAAQLLNAISPLATLERGYAIVTDRHGALVSHIDGVQPGHRLTTRLINGVIHSTVDQIDATAK